MDLPLKSLKHEYKRLENHQIEITPQSNIILLTKELGEGKMNIKKNILLSQNITTSDENNNCLFNNLVRRTLYHYQTIATNISNKSEKFEIFVQIPQGAIPLNESQYSQNYLVNLGKYETKSFTTYFYFPKEGNYSQPQTIATKSGEILSIGDKIEYKINDKEIFIKKSKDKKKEAMLHDPEKLHEILANNSDPKEILKYFENDYFDQSDLDKVKYYLKGKQFFEDLFNILKKRGFYDPQVWAYGFEHKNIEAIKGYLSKSSLCKNNIHSFIDTSLLKIDEIDEAKMFPFFEFAPMLNARVHTLGGNKKENNIPNQDFKNVYENFIKFLLTLPEIDIKYQIILVYYLILQDRLTEAFNLFNKIKIENNTDKNNKQSFQIQYDYIESYFDLSFGFPDFKKASKNCFIYKNFPLVFWREKFEEIEYQLNEYNKKPAQEELENDKNLLKQMKSNEPMLNFNIENKKLSILFSNLDFINIKFYEIDLEILFSRNPNFIQNSDDFSFVLPSFSKEIKLDKNKKDQSLTYDIPEEYLNKNLFIEVNSKSIKKFQIYYSSSLKVLINSNVGELKVYDAENNPIRKAYVKVFAELRGEGCKFYKDGYTDLRGIFNYLAINTRQIQKATKFYLFISDEKLGCTIQECLPPSNFGSIDSNLGGRDAALQRRLQKLYH